MTINFDFLSLPDVRERVLRKWESSTPFSLVRLGDGELSVLQYPQTDDRRMQHVLRRAMTDRVYIHEEISEVKAGMVRASLTADVLATYDSFGANDLTLTYTDTFESVGVDKAVACHPNIHFYLQGTGLLDQLLSESSRVTLISGREAQSQVQELYPNALIDQIKVPVERQYALKSEEVEPHFPDFYRRVKEGIAPEGPRHLFLIGAGILAKEYCSIVKERGGFAIDIGSVFDYWAGVPTREGQQVIKDGELVFTGESRWPNITLGSDYTNGHADIQNSKFRSMLRPMKIVDRPKN